MYCFVFDFFPLSSCHSVVQSLCLSLCLSPPTSLFLSSFCPCIPFLSLSLLVPLRPFICLDFFLFRFLGLSLPFLFCFGSFRWALGGLRPHPTETVHWLPPQGRRTEFGVLPEKWGSRGRDSCPWTTVHSFSGSESELPWDPRPGQDPLHPSGSRDGGGDPHGSRGVYRLFLPWGPKELKGSKSTRGEREV